MSFLEWCGIGIMVFAAFLAGRSYEAGKLAKSWEEVEQEWVELHREKVLWHSQKLNEFSSSERRSKSVKS